MKVILEIPDNKASSLLDVLKSISFVKIEPISSAKAKFLKELRQSVDQVLIFSLEIQDTQKGREL